MREPGATPWSRPRRPRGIYQDSSNPSFWGAAASIFKSNMAGGINDRELPKVNSP